METTIPASLDGAGYLYGPRINARIDYLRANPKEAPEELKDLEKLCESLRYDGGFQPRTNPKAVYLVHADNLRQHIQAYERPKLNASGIVSAQFVDWSAVVEYFKDLWPCYEFDSEIYYAVSREYLPESA
jgi:hypothetical protein